MFGREKGDIKTNSVAVSSEPPHDTKKRQLTRRRRMWLFASERAGFRNMIFYQTFGGLFLSGMILPATTLLLYMLVKMTIVVPIPVWGVVWGALFLGSFPSINIHMAIVRKRRQKEMLEGEGQGGSARFMTTTDITEGGYRWKWGEDEKQPFYYLGTLTNDRVANTDRWHVGYKEWGHWLIVAATGGGKAFTLQIPNLLNWRYSAFIVDIKGEFHRITAARRGMGGGRVTDYLGGRVLAIDPYHDLARKRASFLKKGDPQYTGQECRFNPFFAIDEMHLDAISQVDTIADALMIDTENKSDTSEHFKESAKQILTGCICYILINQSRFLRAKDGEEPLQNPKRSLVGLYERLVRSEEEHNAFLKEIEAAPLPPEESPIHLLMSEAKSALTAYQKAGDREQGGFYTTMRKSLAWVNRLRHHLEYCDIDLGWLRESDKPTTIYFVIPDNKIKESQRYVQIVTRLVKDKIYTTNTSPPYPCLMLLDELRTLGRIDDLPTWLSTARDADLWIMIATQSLTDLTSLYGKDAGAILENCDITTFMKVNGQETAVAISDLCGNRLKIVGPDGDLPGNKTAVKLVEPNEVRRLLQARKGEGRMIALLMGEIAMLERRSYVDLFQPNAFNENGKQEPLDPDLTLDPGPRLPGTPPFQPKSSADLAELMRKSDEEREEEEREKTARANGAVSPEEGENGRDQYELVLSGQNGQDQSEQGQETENNRQSTMPRPRRDQKHNLSVMEAALRQGQGRDRGRDPSS